MGRIKKTVIGLTGLLGVTLLAVGVAAAASNDRLVSGNTDHSVYQAGRSIDINGRVNGDIFCVGQTVDISATVSGDVICAAQTINVSGHVLGSVRLVGQNVNLLAAVSKNASIIAQTANLSSDGSIGQDLTVLAQSADVNSPVGRDLNGRVGQLTLNSSLGRNVSVSSSQLTLDSRARIGGSVSYSGPNRLQKNSGATVLGNISYRKVSGHRAHSWSGALFLVYLAVSFLVLDMVLVAIWPKLLGRSLRLKSFWRSLLVGFIAMFATPAAIIALTASFIGLPLAILLGLAWLGLLILSWPVSAFYVGSLILKRDKRAPLVMLTGGVLLALVSLIPIIGWIVAIVALWFGSGLLLRLIKKSLPKPNYRLER